MSQPQLDSSHVQQNWTDWLFIVASVGVMIAQILVVRASTGETPMLSANDRSRWCTVRALVENGHYHIDEIIRERHPETNRRFWSSIDRVRHRGPDGKEHDYSSKPTLFPTMLAGEYWLIRQVTGLTLAKQPFATMRLMLVITNVLPLILYFYVLARLINGLALTDRARTYAMAAATFATFLTTFSVTINNHSVAAITVLLAVALTLPIWRQETTSGWAYFGAGLFGAFAAANELPALSFLAVVGAAIAWRSVPRTLMFAAPGVALVAAGFFGTNYLAHGTWVPAYAHRSDGPKVTEIGIEQAAELDAETLTPEIRQQMKAAGIELSDQALVLMYQPGERWGIWDRKGQKRFALVPVDNQIEIRKWANWYDYDGSYWRNRQSGVDRGEPSRAAYFFHTLLGHHGVISLTPIWILSAVGVVMMVVGQRPGWRVFALMVVLMSLVCLAFYISRPLGDRNYGGVSCCFRWLVWFTPLWILCLVPAADWLLKFRFGRVLGLVALLVSVVSVVSRMGNPWSHPWIYELGSTLGWWHY
jgi:hypothetical protein